MNQITIRGLPENLERHVREISERDGVSLNRTVIRLLEQATGLPCEKKRKRDLSSIAGRWSKEEAAEFDRLLGPLEEIDEEMWK